MPRVNSRVSSVGLTSLVNISHAGQEAVCGAAKGRIAEPPGHDVGAANDHRHRRLGRPSHLGCPFSSVEILRAVVVLHEKHWARTFLLLFL